MDKFKQIDAEVTDLLYPMLCYPVVLHVLLYPMLR